MTRSLFPAPVGLPELRPYQADVLERARCHYADGATSVLIVAPTGAGKTRITVEACRLHVERTGGTPLFVAPRRELLTQATRTLVAGGLEPEHDCFVRSIQELIAKNAVIPPATLVVLDEARHFVAEEWGRLRAALPRAIFLGADATPERADGLGLKAMFDALVEAITVAEAMRQGYLVPCEILRPPHPLGSLELAQDPVDIYFDRAAGTSCIVYASSVDHAKELAEKYTARGELAIAVHGEMSTKERDVAIERFSAGKVRILTNFQILVEGFDAPRTETIILATGCPTAGNFLQRVGRGLRPFPGKTRCLLIDLPGVSHLHGEPDEERTWHLDGKAARRVGDDVEVRFCLICGAVVPGAACEQCGNATELRKRRPRVLGLPCDRFARERAMPEEARVKALARLFRAERALGHRPGWALHIHKHKFGTSTPEMVRAARRMT